MSLRDGPSFHAHDCTCPVCTPAVPGDRALRASAIAIVASWALLGAIAYVAVLIFRAVRP